MSEILNNPENVNRIHYFDYDVDSNGNATIGYGKYTAEVVIKYDGKSRKTDEVYYAQPNQIYFRRQFSYNKKGYLIQNMTYFGNETKSNDGYHFAYNKKGKVKMDTLLYEGKCKENNIYEYDRKGNLIATSYYYWEHLQTFTQYTYNKNGECSEVYIEHYEPYANVKTISYTQKIINQFDAKGNKVQVQQFGSDNQIQTTTNYTYNDQNQLIEEKSTNYQGAPFNWFQNEYDSGGNKIRIIYHASDEPTITEWKMQYEYDENGNWTTISTSIDGKPTEIETRKIEYK